MMWWPEKTYMNLKELYQRLKYYNRNIWETNLRPIKLTMKRFVNFNWTAMNGVVIKWLMVSDMLILWNILGSIVRLIARLW